MDSDVLIASFNVELAAHEPISCSPRPVLVPLFLLSPAPPTANGNGKGDDRYHLPFPLSRPLPVPRPPSVLATSPWLAFS